jgi:hypothetical protein
MITKGIWTYDTIIARWRWRAEQSSGGYGMMIKGNWDLEESEKGRSTLEVASAQWATASLFRVSRAPSPLLRSNSVQAKAKANVYRSKRGREDGYTIVSSKSMVKLKSWNASRTRESSDHPRLPVDFMEQEERERSVTWDARRRSPEPKRSRRRAGG